MSLFGNPWPHEPQRLVDIVRWKAGLRAKETPLITGAPDEPADWRAISRKEILMPPEIGWRVTWLGHASFLLQGAGASMLIDPVFANHCAPLPFPGLKRLIPPPCTLDDLPRIDAILLSHTHYDHLDLPTLRKIGVGTTIIIAEGHASWLRKRGFENVRELPWHESIEFSKGIKVTATPAQHFTARTLFDRNHGHWCGFLIEGAGCKLWHAGDSGYCEGFKEIGACYGPIDLGMIPIGAYNPRWIMKPMHMNPEEAVRVLLETQCRRAIAMHWGTFRLTDEPMGEPVLLLGRAIIENALDPDRFVAVGVGEALRVMPEPT